MAAVALVEPQMAENPAQAPMVATASPPPQVPQKLVGRVEESPADPRVVGNLTHEDKQGDDGQVVGAEHGETVLGHELQRRVPGDEEGKAEKAHEGHDEAHGDLQEHEGDQDDKPVNPGFRGSHGLNPLFS